ncbi:unnamed protein product [Phytophthora lilii]|uniref:Unnamed protein product n=1 Tax=Phytophthora lilii TaxID=2077276 RepID=A0A9W6XGP5_9STRA|nr:unnamed protein product [Phytophthora lilii]
MSKAEVEVAIDRVVEAPGHMYNSTGAKSKTQVDCCKAAPPFYNLLRFTQATRHPDLQVLTMNAPTVLAIAAVALVGSVAASSSSSSDACSSSQQTSAYTTLASLLTLDSFQGCVDDSSYSLLYSTSLPTDAEYVKMCASSDCQSLIESIISLSPPDCTLDVPTSSLEVNVYELANGFSSICSSLSSDSSASTTTTSTTSTAASTNTDTTSTTTTTASTTSAATSTAASTTSDATTATTAASNSTETATASSSDSTTTSTTTATACYIGRISLDLKFGFKIASERSDPALAAQPKVFAADPCRKLTAIASAPIAALQTLDKSSDPYECHC